MKPDSETTPPPALSAYEIGVLVGLLVGEGHFGGDGRQPQVTLRMHVDHEALFHWLVRRLPGGRLYGPYNHDGRHYYQWMARGRYLREELVPLLDPLLVPELDGRVAARYAAMKERYGLSARAASAVDATAPMPAGRKAGAARRPPRSPK